MKLWMMSCGSDSLLQAADRMSHYEPDPKAALVHKLRPTSRVLTNVRYWHLADIY
jgi:hypothetical protein